MNDFMIIFRQGSRTLSGCGARAPGARCIRLHTLRCL